MPFEFIAWVKYRTNHGEWWPIGKVGASADEASIYLDAFFVGQCFAFPFDGKQFPYLHGHINAFDGHYKNGSGLLEAKWIRCGYIWSDEVDGSNMRGLERIGTKLYGIRIDALPLRLNKKGSIVLKVCNE